MWRNSCLNPDVSRKEAILGSTCLSLKSSFAVTLPILGGLQEYFIVPLPLINVVTPACRNPACRQLGFCEAEYVRFNINIYGIGTCYPKGDTTFLLPKVRASLPASFLLSISEHGGAVPAPGHQGAVPAHSSWVHWVPAL